MESHARTRVPVPYGRRALRGQRKARRSHRRAWVGVLALAAALALIAVAVPRFGAESQAVLAGAAGGVLAAIPTSLALARWTRSGDAPSRPAGPVDVVVITGSRENE